MSAALPTPCAASGVASSAAIVETDDDVDVRQRLAVHADVDPGVEHDSSGRVRASWRVSAAVAFMAISGLLFGYDLCIITGTG